MVSKYARLLKKWEEEAIAKSATACLVAKV